MDRILVKYGWQDIEESEETNVLNDLTGLSWGLDSMILKFSYEFIMMNLFYNDEDNIV